MMVCFLVGIGDWQWGALRAVHDGDLREETTYVIRRGIIKFLLEMGPGMVVTQIEDRGYRVTGVGNARVVGNSREGGSQVAVGGSVRVDGNPN